MSADAGMDSAAPNLNLSAEEKRVYGQLFRQADSDSVGVVTGEVAVKFFDKTRLDPRILGDIWQIADKENRGFLTPVGFGVVLRLIGHAQAGRNPTAELALQQGPIPRFDGFAPQQAPGSPTAPAPFQAQSPGGSVRIPPLTSDKVTQYAAVFERQALQGNMLPGEQARQIFDKSGLPNETLGRIWELSDTELRGSLTLPEFAIAMHLLTSMKTGALRSLPNSLPPALLEAANQRRPAPRQSPTNTGISAIQRQMSGTAQVRTGSPLGRNARSAGAGTSDWAVTPNDKAKFDQIYNTLDKTNKGFITGEEAVPFFSQANLPEDALAQVWDLADFTSQGHLSRDGFAVAMYLIRQQRSGPSNALPTTLPANLVPPSMRNQTNRTAGASAFDPPTMTQPPPQPKSALDELFGLESSTPSPAPAASLQTTMSTGGSNANDPFAGGSGAMSPSSPVNSSSTFKPFVPSSSFGRGLTTQGPSDGTSQQGKSASAVDDLLADHDETSKQISGESTELANLSSQIGTLSTQTQEVQSKRTTTQNELNQTNSQKQNFEQRLAQLRTLYEKEAQDTRALEEQLRNSRSETKKLQGECMTLEGTYGDIQTQHQQVLSALQADQQENTTLRERIRVVNAEIAQLKPKIEKLKLEGRQQKGLVAINKKQLSTTEGERERLKSEAADLAKGGDDISRQTDNPSPASASAQVTSPALSTTSANNPFFKRTASTDIMGAFATPPARTLTSDKSVDDVFGPSVPASSGTPPPPAAFTPQLTGASSASTERSAPVLSRQGTLTTEPPAPPESRQISSSFLPFTANKTESLSSSRQVSPPASRADDKLPESSTPLANDATESSSIPGAFPSDDDAKDGTPSTTPVAAGDQPKSVSEQAGGSGEADAFGSTDHAKAKADFDDAFAAFKTSKAPASSAPDGPKTKSAFDTEFPPIADLEDEDDDSDSESEKGGFDDDFAPGPPPTKSADVTDAGKDIEPSADKAAEANEAAPPSVPAKEPAQPTENSSANADHPSSPATITNSGAPMSAATVDDIFGSAAAASDPPVAQVGSSTAAGKGVFDDSEDEFEGLEEAKEGSADDDFANISRDDFNPVFDSSPPASQARSESTAFGNESGFDFVSHNSATGAPAASSGAQQTGAASHDWDAIFAGLDSPGNTTPPAPSGTAATGDEQSSLRPPAPGRALTDKGEHDDPILKNLTGMGYSRNAAVAALEKYDYNLERAANFLASES